MLAQIAEITGTVKKTMIRLVSTGLIEFPDFRQDVLQQCSTL